MLYCDNCQWTQDDFWSLRGYNPVRFFFKNELPWLWRPRFMGTDRDGIVESKVARRLGLIREVNKPWPGAERAQAVNLYGRPVPEFYIEHQQHTWYMLVCSARKWARRIRRQKWWTARSFNRAKTGEHWPNCPKCGQHKLVAD